MSYDARGQSRTSGFLNVRVGVRLNGVSAFIEIRTSVTDYRELNSQRLTDKQLAQQILTVVHARLNQMEKSAQRQGELAWN